MALEIILQLAMAVVVFFSIRPKNIKDFCKKVYLKKIPAKLLAISAGKYLVMMLIASMAIGALFYSFGMQEDAQAVSEIISEIPFYYSLLLILCASIFEELFFRSYLLPRTNIWAATFLFALSHLGYGSVTEICGAFVLGFLLATQFEEQKNIVPVMITHFLYNFLVLLAISV